MYIARRAEVLGQKVPENNEPLFFLETNVIVSWLQQKEYVGIFKISTNHLMADVQEMFYVSRS